MIKNYIYALRHLQVFRRRILPEISQPSGGSISEPRDLLRSELCQKRGQIPRVLKSAFVGQTNRQTDGWLDRWIDGLIDRYSSEILIQDMILSFYSSKFYLTLASCILTVLQCMSWKWWTISKGFPGVPKFEEQSCGESQASASSVNGSWV